jgi:ssDNA-binding replication factor A large subunit
MLSKEELIKEIADKSGKSDEDVKKLVKEKQAELSGLVSSEGAAYIVGRELGVNLIKDARRKLKISNIVPGMRAVDIVAKVVNLSNPIEFERNGKAGKVVGIVLGDETGTVRLPLWNDEVKLVSSVGIGNDDIIEVSGAWTKEDKRSGGVELRLGKRGSITKVEGKEMPDVKAAPASEYKKDPGQDSPVQRIVIGSARPGMNVLVKGCFVQVYRKKPYYEACPQCGTRLEEKDGGWACRDHGKVEPVYNTLLSGVIDDGTGNIRAVFFREQAEKVLGEGSEKLKERFEKEGDAFWESLDILGKDFMISGRVKTNDFSQEPEILASSVADVDVKSECKQLLETLSE